jgi:ribose 5-phosphate isomerase B
MKVAVGCDPNAAALKNEVREELESLGHTVTDFGADDPIYANVVIDVAEAVVRGEYDRGVVLCGTGLGASIAANKVPGAFCALVTDCYQAERASLSNNANILALGAQVTGPSLARRLVATWIAVAGQFDQNGRSAPKVARIAEYEQSKK